MFDFHMHSIVSFDGHDTPEEMARAAVAAGLQEICFTDHMDADPSGIYTDFHFSFEEYAAAYDHLQIPGLTIRRGMEFGLLEDNQAMLTECLQKRKFDFVIGSIHFVDGEDVYFEPFWQGKTVFEAERLYLEDMLLCLQKHEDFDVLGHLTYLSKSPAHPTHTPIPYEAHKTLVDEILRTLVKKEKGMEINTSGVDRCGDFLPGAVYLQRFKELGGRIVTMGSDAHTSDRVGQYHREAAALLKDIFGYVCTFADRKPIFHQL